MDKPSPAHLKLFDDLLEVLNKHGKEDRALGALEYLQAAKFNYSQGAMNHMMSCLVLALDQLAACPAGSPLLQDLRAAVRGFVRWVDEATARMTSLAREYEAGGGKLLSQEEILAEVSERRGGTH